MTIQFNSSHILNTNLEKNTEPKSNTKIIHIDMDCFYAAVEEKHNPQFVGKPLAVGGPPNSRSVICTANYAARRFGVKAAIPSSRAVQLCPQLILIPPHFDLYKKESQKMKEILFQYTSKVETVSLDEAYLDVTDSPFFQGSATRLAMEIRQQIWNQTRLSASAGVAPNKFLAKIASDWKKPNGLFVIRPEEVEGFMPSLKIEKIHGVGKVTAAKMHENQIFTCGDLQKLSKWQISRLFGSSRAEELFNLCRGIDHRSLNIDSPRKSLSVEETFDRDLVSWPQIEIKIPQLYREWIVRMGKQKQKNLMIKSLCVKIKTYDFRSRSCEQAWLQTQSNPSIQDFALLLKRAWSQNPVPWRLIGLGVKYSSSWSEEAQLCFDVA